MTFTVPKISYSLLRKLFGILIFIELFAFGSGQLIKIHGNLTLRILFFILMVFLGLVNVAMRKKIDKNVSVFLIYLTSLLALSSILGLINSSIDLVLIDLKSLAYFFTIIFFYYYIRDLKDILLIVRILTTTAFIISILYLLHVLFLALNLYSFEDVYATLTGHKDFRFRGANGIFYYKGFIFLPIALVFINIRKGLVSFQGMCILLAIYFIETRALWLIAIIAYLFSGVYLLNKSNFKISFVKSISLVIILSVLVIFILNNFAGLSGDRAGGDRLRIETIKQVIERVNALSLFIGHGLGVGVPIRPIHMEMSYLEIFHKQGLIGLLIWLLLLFDCLKSLFLKNVNIDLIAAFCFSILIVYIQSLFNPYLTNSMGIGYIVIAYVSIKRLGQIKNSSL